MSKLDALEKDLAEVLNRHGVDAMSNIPDYVLAKYIVSLIAAAKSLVIDIAKHKG